MPGRSEEKKAADLGSPIFPGLPSEGEHSVLKPAPHLGISLKVLESQGHEVTGPGWLICSGWVTQTESLQALIH